MSAVRVVTLLPCHHHPDPIKAAHSSITAVVSSYIFQPSSIKIVFSILVFVSRPYYLFFFLCLQSCVIRINIRLQQTISRETIKLRKSDICFPIYLFSFSSSFLFFSFVIAVSVLFFRLSFYTHPLLKKALTVFFVSSSGAGP